MSITQVCSSRVWLRSIGFPKDLHGQSKGWGVLGGKSREVGGLPGSLFFPKVPFCSLQEVPVLAERSVESFRGQGHLPV